MTRILGFLMAMLALPALAAEAYFDGDEAVGMNRICYYSYLGNRYAITISADQLCPESIEVAE